MLAVWHFILSQRLQQISAVSLILVYFKRGPNAGTAIGHIGGFCKVLIAYANSLALKSRGNLTVNKNAPPGERQ